jgi:hypothetical protein
MGPVIKPGELARATNSFLDEVFARPWSGRSDAIRSDPALGY